MQGGLHRLLLAVPHRALSGPKDSAEAHDLLDRGGFPNETVNAYLERYRERFDFFHPEHPFYQVADFDVPADKLAPVTRLIAEAASGNNATLFDHSVDDRVEARSAGEVARLLVAHQTFALGGGRSALGYTAHAPVATAQTTSRTTRSAINLAVRPLSNATSIIPKLSESLCVTLPGPCNSCQTRLPRSSRPSFFGS